MATGPPVVVSNRNMAHQVMGRPVATAPTPQATSSNTNNSPRQTGMVQAAIATGMETQQTTATGINSSSNNININNTGPTLVVGMALLLHHLAMRWKVQTPTPLQRMVEVQVHREDTAVDRLRDREQEQDRTKAILILVLVVTVQGPFQRQLVVLVVVGEVATLWAA